MTVQDKIVAFLKAKGSSATFKELLEASQDGWAKGVPVKERGLKIQLSKMIKLGKLYTDKSKWFWATSEETVNSADSTSVPEDWSWFKPVNK